MSKPLGVGIIGAGAVTQAIHLPTIATLSDRLQVVHIMDVNAEVGALVASRTGARSTTNVQTLLEDPEVDVVAICSPGQFHAAQVEAATAAGKRAILCEKPLATTVEEAQLIADVSSMTGVPVVVGAMHVYDPAFAAAQKSWGDLPDTATLVRVAVYLPNNDDMVNLATELAAPAPAPDHPPTLPRRRFVPKWCAAECWVWQPIVFRSCGTSCLRCRRCWPPNSSRLGDIN